MLVGDLLLVKTLSCPEAFVSVISFAGSMALAYEA